MSSLNQSSPVAKTAFDALQAKQSAVLAGYDPIVCSNQEMYEYLLHCVTSSMTTTDSSTSTSNSSSNYDLKNNKTSKNYKIRNQTPLVNAGYAARVLSISQAIYNFIAFHKLRSGSGGGSHSNNTDQIQLIFIGCGADIIGLWAHSLDTKRITIIEMDTPEVCAFKRKLFARNGLVIPTKSTKNAPDDILTNDERTSSSNQLFGTIKLNSKGNDSMEDSKTASADDDDDDTDAAHTAPINYKLFPVDLKNTKQLDTTISIDPSKNNDNNDKNVVNTQIPRMIISELVLSYLGTDHVIDLLKWCSSKIFYNNPNSLMVALEPLGYNNQSVDSVSGVSIIEGYKRDYCNQFNQKMSRGTSLHTNRNTNIQKSESSSSSFQPFGKSFGDIAKIYQRTGFILEYVASLGKVLSTNGSNFGPKGGQRRKFRIPDNQLFDEHAALWCHLKSYAVSYGFSNGTEEVFCRIMCPSKYMKIEIEPAVVDDVVYTVIEPCDEEQVRKLFQDTYSQYFDDYPAIRKMVNGVLKTEFLSSVEDSSTSSTGKMDSASSSNDTISSIARYYKTRGGCFFVAVLYEYDNDYDVDDKERQQPQRRIRRVVGCAGVRQCESSSSSSSSNNNNKSRRKAVNTSKNYETLEVFRLAVDVDHRGRGIGTKLLEMILEYAASRGSKVVVVNTLTILDTALQLYQSNGFEVEGDKRLGSLTLRTLTRNVKM